MKKLAKFICLILTLFIACGSFAACGGVKVDRTALQVFIHEAGFGHDWLKDVATAYRAETGVKVQVRGGDQESEVPKIQTGKSNYDIVFYLGDTSYLAELNLFAELTDSVYNKAPYGEESSNVKIKDISPFYNALEAYESDKRFAVSYSASVQGVLYNIDVLDMIYGQGQWGLPNTSNEWISMLEYIKTNSTGGTADALNPNKAYGLVSGSDYMEYVASTWWAQYDGTESYFEYWKGYDNGVPCTSDPTFALTDGRLEALKTLESVYKKTTGYVHANNSIFVSKTREAQEVFLGYGYKSIEMRKVAFYPCGDWFENEMGEEMVNKNIRMMKVPVISSIVNTFVETDKAMSDEQLSVIIAKIDAGTAYSKEEYGCEKSTYDKVFAARNTVSTNGELQQAVILKTSNKKDKAADFLRFMISKVGQSCYAQELKGLHMGYGYDPTTDEEVEISPFVQSTLDMVNANTVLIYRDISTKLAHDEDMVAFTYASGSNNYSSPIYNGTMTAQEIYNKHYDILKANLYN